MVFTSRSEEGRLSGAAPAGDFMVWGKGGIRNSYAIHFNLWFQLNNTMWLHVCCTPAAINQIRGLHNC